eukprot:6675181-Ditylum_brightwellii.AAC.1
MFTEEIYSAASNAVSSIQGAERYALGIMQLLQKIQGGEKPKQISPRIHILRDLFYQPGEMEKKAREDCMKYFGPHVIQEFVLRKPDYKVLRGDQVEVYVDVLEVLAKFGNKAKMPRRA